MGLGGEKRRRSLGFRCVVSLLWFLCTGVVFLFTLRLLEFYIDTTFWPCEYFPMSLTSLYTSFCLFVLVFLLLCETLLQHNLTLPLNPALELGIHAKTPIPPAPATTGLSSSSSRSNSLVPRPLLPAHKLASLGPHGAIAPVLEKPIFAYYR
jgi:hypothetical protein